MCSCPLCGNADAKIERVEVILEENTMFVDGRPIKLCATEAELAYALRQKMPRLATKDHVISQVWGACNDLSNPESSLGTSVHKLRRAISDTALSLITIPGRGFKFAFDVASGQIAA